MRRRLPPSRTRRPAAPRPGWGRPLLAALALFGAGTARAVDTAFWEPYERDEKTWFLASFDDVPGAAEDGRFGRAWKGPAAYTWTDAPVLVGGSAALEAWVRLDRLPEERAWVIRREGEPGKSRSLELFVEPDGALGVAYSALGGGRGQLVSEPGAVAPGAWRHVAATVKRADLALFLDGRELARRLVPSGSARFEGSDRETAAAPVRVGGGLPGLVDQARIHLNVAKFWPRPDDAWIRRLAAEGPAAPARSFLPGTRAVVHLPCDADPAQARLPDGLRLSGQGRTVDGVLGRAWSGPLTLSGPLASAREGALAFWIRPRGYANRMDQNRTLLNTSLFSLYFWNSSHGLRPVTLFFRRPDRRMTFAQDATGAEMYSGRWVHVVVSWGDGRLTWYLDGEPVASCAANFAGEALTRLTFSPRGFGDVDEVTVFGGALTAEEAVNAWRRYADPARVEPPREPVADLAFWHLPSERRLYARVAPDARAAPAAPVELLVRDAEGRVVFRGETPRPPAGAEEVPVRAFDLPALDGEYGVSVRIGEAESAPQRLSRPRFAWEGNTLGVTDEVFPPFEPVTTDGPRVGVVGRAFVMNAFGLWDRVTSVGREILAGPARLVAVNDAGRELDWEGGVELEASEPARAVYRAASRCAALAVETTSEVEVDGMMKVTLRLRPVEGAEPLERLSLEIPLRGEVATLMQEYGRSPRAGFTGAIPAAPAGANGETTVWDSRRTLRNGAWLNAFTSYVWLGGPERGLCWFAENDRGWITAKNHDRPLLRIDRRGDAVVLRVDFVNVPGRIEAPTELVFGLQVSPAKPVPADIARKGDTLPGVGVPVHPWGGLSCAWKSPWMDRWEVADQVVAARAGRPVDGAFFDRFVEQFDPPPVHGIRPWREDIGIFLRKEPAGRPDPMYFEEMRVLPFLPEYYAFQDEWSLVRLPERRFESVDVYRDTGGREINPGARVNFCTSYQDYALALMDEWWKRGVTIYWDNTYPRLAYNPWTSAAYVAQDGRRQPAFAYWNEREYLRRTWNLMNAWRKRGTPRPLEFVVHMTNANILPFFSWATVNYDMELSQSIYAKTHPERYTPGEPFPPAYLLASSTGRQVGNYPYLVHDLFQSSLPAEAWATPDTKTERGTRSWGMRTVHQIVSGGTNSFLHLNRALAAFGYGTDAVKTRLYWDDEPAFRVEHDDVRGLLLTRAADRKMLLVLQSWSRDPLRARVAFDAERIGFAPGATALEGLDLGVLPVRDAAVEVPFDFPYQTRLLLVGAEAPAGDVLFADDFDDWLHPGWDYVSDGAAPDGGRLRLGAYRATWRGPMRLIKYRGLPSFSDGELRFRVRLGRPPAQTATVFDAGFGVGLKWSGHGLTHSRLDRGEPAVTVSLEADPAAGWTWRARVERDGRTERVAAPPAGPVDDGEHEVRIAAGADGRLTVAWDGVEQLALDGASPGRKSAFEIAFPWGTEAFGGIELDDLALRVSDPDREAMAAADGSPAPAARKSSPRRSTS